MKVLIDSTPVNLDAYFARIGYRGPKTATLETLRSIHTLHTEVISFENLNPLLKLPVCLDTASLEAKLVRGGRGGYCFEHNLLFGRVLTALGFVVTGLMARSAWSVKEGEVSPRTHMILKVEIQGLQWIADVGFGGQILTGPLQLKSDLVQETTHEPFRILQEGDSFLLQSEIYGQWRSVYRFDLQEQFLVDYEIGNWFCSTHPDSRFVSNLVAARTAPGLRYVLLNDELAIYRLHGSTERIRFASTSDLKSALQDIFLLKLPECDELESVLFGLISCRVS